MISKKKRWKGGEDKHKKREEREMKKGLSLSKMSPRGGWPGRPKGI